MIKHAKPLWIVENNKDLDGIQRVGVAISAMMTECLKELPMWMRFNYIANQCANTEDLSIIDWHKVNAFLNTNIGKYDFNNFDELKSIDDVNAATFGCIAAGEGLGAFRKGVCKDCGLIYYMDKSEVDSFQKKGFEIPKRCKPCRDIRRGIIAPLNVQKNDNNLVIAKNNHTETAMEIAIRKAGLIK